MEGGQRPAATSAVGFGSWLFYAYFTGVIEIMPIWGWAEWMPQASGRGQEVIDTVLVKGQDVCDSGRPFGGKEMNTKAKADEENPLQDPRSSPELAGVPITKAALWGAGWVLRGCLGLWECLRLCG